MTGDKALAMHLEIVEDYAALSHRAAEIVANLVQTKPNAVLGLPTGSTPIGFYAALAERGLSLAGVTTFNLDEYLGLPRDHEQSYYTFMKQHLFDKTDLDPARCHIPDGMAADPVAEGERYEAAIRAAGGIDLVILGVGLNGHIGFNEPGSPFDARTRQVDLAEDTRQANARFFESIDQVPTHALTMGIGTILEAKQVLLLASGNAKAEIIREAMHGEVREDLPVTVLQRHPNVTILVDKAAGRLTER